MEKVKTVKRLFMAFVILSMAMISWNVQSRTACAAQKSIKSVTLKNDSKKVTEKTLKITKGESEKLKVSVKPASSKKSITYQSKDEDIVSVTKNGKLKAKKAGTAKIIVTVKGKDGVSKKVWVKIKVTKKKKNKADDSDTPNDSIEDTSSSNGTPSENNNPAGNTSPGNSVPDNNAIDNGNSADGNTENKNTEDKNTVNENNNSDTNNNSSSGVNVIYGGSSSSGGGSYYTSKGTVYVLFISNDGSSTITQQTVSRGSTVKQPKDPVWENNIFKGWYTAANGGEKFDFSKAVTDDILMLYAQWEGIPFYSVTFDLNYGDKVENIIRLLSNSVEAAPTETDTDTPGTSTPETPEAPTPPTTEAPGTSTNPSPGGSAPPSSTVDDNTVDVATPIITLVRKGNLVEKPSDPARYGYTFTGWYTAADGGELFDFNTPITSDLTLYAHWNKNEDTPDVDNPTIGGGTDTPGDDGPSYTPGGDECYDVIFETNYYNDPSMIDTVKKGELVEKPENPTLIANTFLGWYTTANGDEEFDFTKPITSDTTIYAHWVENDTNVHDNIPDDETFDYNEFYEVSFNQNYNNGKINVKWVGKNSLVKQPENPERIGYTFDGWYIEKKGDDKFDFNSMVTDNITLYAHWVKNVETYTITFVNNLNYTTFMQAVKKGETAIRPKEAIYNGCVTNTNDVFDGWYTTPEYSSKIGEKFDFNTVITDDITLYSHWSDFSEGDPGFYKVIFNMNYNGLTGIIDICFVKTGGLVKKPEGFIIPGNYTFDGWYTAPEGGEKFDFDSTAITMNTILYAHWIPLKE